MFSLNNINNGTLRSTKSMPQKDITSDNQSTFSMGRRKYVRTLGVDTTLVNNNIPDTIRQNIQKKWYGNSSVRDSTRVLHKLVNNEVGNGSLNSSGTSMSFTSDSAIVPEISNLNAIDGSGSATLTFDIDNGGSLITNYQYAIYNGINLVNLQSIGPSINNPYLLPDSLIPGTQYKIYLTAYNKRGEGSSDTYVIPSTIPAAPSNLALNYTNSIITYDLSVSYTTRTAYITFTPPSTGPQIGWSPIVSYDLIVKDSANNTITYTFSSGSTQIIPKLNVVKNYRFSLIPYNKNGVGTSSSELTSTINAVPPHNIDLSAIILEDTSNNIFYNKVNFTNPNVPTIDISFRILTAPTNNGGSSIVGYNYNCSNITNVLTFNSVTTIPQRNVITLNANTLNTINIYARNSSTTTNGIAINIPKTITYTPFIPPPKPIILSASITDNSFNVTFMTSNAYPSYSPITGYYFSLNTEFAGKGCGIIVDYSLNIPYNTNTIYTYTMNLTTSLQCTFSNTKYRTNIYSGQILSLSIIPVSTYNYKSIVFSDLTGFKYIGKTNSFIYGNKPIWYSTGIKYIPGDKKVMLYDFSLNNTNINGYPNFVNDYVVYSHSLDNKNWSTTDLFVNATLPDNNNSYNLYVRAHNYIGISNTYTIQVIGQSTPPTPVMAVYQYLSGVLLVATPGTYVSKYLDEVIYSYDKYSVTYSYSFDNAVYINFPEYSTPTNRRQVFIKNIPSGTTFSGNILASDTALTSGTQYTLYLRSTSINSNVSSVRSTSFTFTPVDISGNGNASSNYNTFKIGDLRYMIWPSSGSITFLNSGTIEILMVGGGGAGASGGGGNGGGGGAGEVLNGFINILSNSQYTINVPNSLSTTNGNNSGKGGSNVDFSGIIVAYGGNGGNGDDHAAYLFNTESFACGGGASYYNNPNSPTITSNCGPTYRKRVKTRQYVDVINNPIINQYIYSYGGNQGTSALLSSTASINAGHGGGSGTPGLNTITLKYGGAGTNKVSDWILDISGVMDRIVSSTNKSWSNATIKDNVGYIASGGSGNYTNAFNETIDETYNPELYTSQLFGYGGGGLRTISGIYNTGGGGGSESGKKDTSGLVVIRYYE